MIERLKNLEVKKWVIVLLSSIICTCTVFWPLLLNMTSTTTSVDDGSLIAWQVEQVRRAIASGDSVYAQPFFYPYDRTMTYSEPLVSSGVVAVLTSFLRISPIAQLNWQLVVGTVACVATTHLLLLYNTKKVWLSLVGALFFTFSLLRFQYVVHLHSYLVFGIPLAVFGWQRYVDTKKFHYLALLMVSFLFQALNNPMTAYALGLIFLAFLTDKKSRKVIAKDRLIWLTAAAVLIICGLFYWPYVQTVRELGVPFTIRDAAHFSFSLNYLLTIDILLPVTTLLFLIGFNWRRWRQFFISQKVWWLVALLGLICMLGPVAKWHGQTIRFFDQPIPLPYAAVYYFLPGIQSIRSVTRFSMLFGFGLSVVLTQALFISDRKQWQKIIVGVCLSIWVVLSAKHFLPVYNIDTQFPQINQTIKQRDEKILAIMPMYLWPMHPYVSAENERLLNQLDHDKMLYNGMSGFVPPQRSKDISTHWRAFPDDESIELLKAAGVELLLVEYDRYQQMYDAHYVFEQTSALDSGAIKTHMQNRSDLELLTCAQTDCLYRIKY